MSNLSLWLGLLAVAAIAAWNMARPGANYNIVNAHGLIVVLGGVAAAILISTPFAQLFSAARALLQVLGPGRLPTPEAVATEIVRVTRRAYSEGGLLALRDEPAAFAEGFLQRAVSAAATCPETSATRNILELEIRRRRVARQEDANVFRTLATLAPMFGLLGTLLGMLDVLTNMSDPSKLGPAMALALSSAFLGIGTATLLCIPIASQIRLLAMRETIALEMIIEGIIAIAEKKPVYEVELRMGAYLGAAAARGPA